MKKTLLTAGLLILITGSALGGVINDIRTGVVPVGSYVTVTGAVVTAVLDNSFIAAETETGPNRSLWVYLGDVPMVAEGDVIDVHGIYIEDNDRAMLSLLNPVETWLTITGSAPLPDNQATVAELMADAEGWESTRVFVTDGLVVQDIMENGQWLVASYETGHFMVLDDYFGLFPNVAIAECYNNADGVFFLYGGEYVLKTLAVEYVDCTVGNESLSLGSVKRFYR